MLQNLPEGLRELGTRGLQEDGGATHPLPVAVWDVEIGAEKKHQVLLGADLKNHTAKPMCKTWHFLWTNHAGCF